MIEIPKPMSDADLEIQACLDLSNLKSFFLFAGAGSGKTGSLITALKYLSSNYRKRFQYSGQKIGVITYTNAACDEIKQRIDFNDVFEISTIHSFVWGLINTFSTDIKEWLVKELTEQIQELYLQQAKGRVGTKAAMDRAASIETKSGRLSKLKTVKKFTYNPNGENAGIDALSHTEVLKIGAHLLSESTLLQNAFIGKFPILFIDESQDTNRALMEAFLKIELLYKSEFLLGLFGDTMQRIYADGKIDLGANLPAHWATPEKKINHRSTVRIVQLINKVRLKIDQHQQESGDGKDIGFIRLFVLPSDIKEKDKKEIKVCERMAAITNDELWRNSYEVKQLILEHHMAAKRLNFIEMYEPLYSIDKYRTGLLDGSLSIVRFFSALVLPLVQAKVRKDEFAVAKLLRTHSPLLNKNLLQSTEINQPDQIKRVDAAVDSLVGICNEKSPTFLEVLNLVNEKNLFIIPNSLQTILNRNNSIVNGSQEEYATENEPEDEKAGTEEIVALDNFLKTPFFQIESYNSYIAEKSSFDTHQGVKGRQFPRVMVIIDDSESKGFLFKYEKLFGVEPASQTDISNEKEGNDSSFKRARRLFYVTASRAEKSLAIVAYSKDPNQIKKFAVDEGWFLETEIELF